MNVTFAEWRIEDKLKTAEDRAYYIEAAMEDAISENDPKILAEALGDVAASLKGKSLAMFLLGVATGVATMQPAPLSRVAPRTAAKRPRTKRTGQAAASR